MSDTKQRKPWFRPRNVVLAVLAAVLVFFGWAFLEVWQVYTAEPNPAIDYRAKLRELAEYHAGVSSNHADEAWDFLVAAMNLADEIDSEVVLQPASTEFEPRDEYDQGSIDFLRVICGRVVPSNVDRERRVIELMGERGVFRPLGRLADIGPGLRPVGPNRPLMADRIRPEYLKGQMLAKARVASMRLASAAGDFNEAAAAVDETLALSHTMASQGMLISYLVGRAIEQLTLGELRHELLEAEFSEASCRQILGSLQRHTLPPIELPLEGERLYSYDTIQWSFSDDGAGNGYLVSSLIEYITPTFPEPEQTFFGATKSRFFWPARAEIMKLTDQVVDASLARAQLRPSIRSNVARETMPLTSGYPKGYESVGMLGDSLLQFVDVEPRSSVLREGTRVLVALELFYAQHARWPQALDELVPDILPNVPVDPLHGGPFGYRLVDNDRFGRPYILYSFGLDATDDGGIEFNSGTNDVYRGIEPLTDYNLTGVDYVINKPRPVEW